jgi:FaeA-like protein
VLKVTGRDVPEGEYAVRFEAGARWLLEGDGLAAANRAFVERRASEALDERSRTILGYVNDHPDGVRPAEVATALGIEAHLVRTYLARLSDSGRVTRPARGLYTPVASVASVADEGTDISERNTATDATPLWMDAQDATHTDGTLRQPESHNEPVPTELT